MGLRRDKNLIEDDLILGLEGTRPREEEDFLITELQRARDTPASPISLDSSPEEREASRIKFKLPPKRQLRQQVGKQLGEAKQAFQEGAKERGAFSERQGDRFRQEGLIVGGVQVAQKEFKQSVLAQEQATAELFRISGITDKVLLRNAQEDMQKKMAAARKAILKKAQDLQTDLARKEKSAAKRRMAAAAFGTIVAGAIGGYIANQAFQVQAEPEQDNLDTLDTGGSDPQTESTRGQPTSRDDF